ncbi:MAG TPA: hypothetical protein VMT17_15140 [Anaeromyxobacteraceae bacterium]|nr:hypothetical protein [Anaeromyxobacteraceae bacterium]
MSIFVYFALLALFIALFGRYLSSAGRRRRRAESVYRRRERRTRHRRSAGA